MGERLREWVSGVKERRAARRAAREEALDVPVERESATVLAAEHNPPKQEARVYPGGSQVPEGEFTPLTKREPWTVPEKRHWVPSWYEVWREEVAVWLEIFRRLPSVGGVPIYHLTAIAGLFAVAPLVPGLSWANAPFVGAILLGGGTVVWMDALATFVLQPIVLAAGAFMWGMDRALSLTDGYVTKKDGRDWFAW